MIPLVSLLYSVRNILVILSALLEEPFPRGLPFIVGKFSLIFLEGTIPVRRTGMATKEWAGTYKREASISVCSHEIHFVSLEFCSGCTISGEQF